MEQGIVYSVQLHSIAIENIRYHNKVGNKALVKKISNLLDELTTDPRTGTGKPERLKGFDIETWSRRIDDKHRLVYEIYDDKLTVLAISALGHYGDK